MKRIKIGEIQDERVWVHSNKLGYGHWVYAWELDCLLTEKTIEQSQRCHKGWTVFIVMVN